MRSVQLAGVVAAATTMFEASQPVEMSALADGLRVSRATLYRIAGSRDRILGELLWAQGRASMDDLLDTTPGQGTDRLVGVARRFNHRVLRHAPMRRFLAAEPETALRVLFGRQTGVHRRFVDLWTELLDVEVTAPVREIQQLAYVFVRIGESMVYADLLGGGKPDVELAACVQSLLLGPAGSTAPARG